MKKDSPQYNHRNTSDPKTIHWSMEHSTSLLIVVMDAIPTEINLSRKFPPHEPCAWK